MLPYNILFSCYTIWVYENKSYDLRLCVQFYRSRVNIKNTVRYIEIVKSRYVQLCDKTRKSANDVKTTYFWNQTSVFIAFVTSEHYVENCLIKYFNPSQFDTKWFVSSTLFYSTIKPAQITTNTWNAFQRFILRW